MVVERTKDHLAEDDGTEISRENLKPMSVSMIKAYIGLGSNLENPCAQVLRAIEVLEKLPNSQLIASSSLYSSKPVGPQDQPDFINAVVALETSNTPIELLTELKQIEQKFGRIKKRHWGERIIDLDILLYGDESVSSTNLTIPHKELCHRSFVVTPLLEIDPDIRLPNGVLLRDSHNKFEKDGLVRIHR